MAKFDLPVFGHGGDYNPDQWRHIPGILDEDIRLMKLSGCNLMSVGIFSWAALEPEEGKFDFDWLQDVLDRFAANGIHAFLATPSGARPAWMSQKYPEVLRVRPDGGRNLHGGRHNHCYTSPVYRKFVNRINTALAERFGHHPAVVGWHISNEYGGECHCELCQEAFRGYLKKTYGTLENLNHAWWTGFWAKIYTDWSQLHGPSPIGETCIHGLTLSWKRFVTRQTIDFMNAETEPIRKICPDLPITTNLMGTYEGLDNFKFADSIDFASYDSYPLWGSEDTEIAPALNAAFSFDITRSIKNAPWALMESVTSKVNWHDICKIKRPGVHFLSCMQAVAHGADTVQYFQWRQSRGCSEKLHGAVVDHVGNEHTRVFREVTQVGDALKKMSAIRGSRVNSEVALIFDWDNRWALSSAQGPRKDKQYDEIVQEHYHALLRNGVNVDVIDSEHSFDGYKLIVAPMLYMIKPGVAERLEAFVAAGGKLVVTYFTGIVDENDLCFMGGFPGPLRKLLGVWAEEIDALYPGQKNAMVFEYGEEVECGFLCDVIHAETAETIAVYKDDFYKGMPALTCNEFGEGEAYYLASRTSVDHLADFYLSLLWAADVEIPVDDLPDGVFVTTREAEDGAKFLFVMNFTCAEQRVDLPVGEDVLTGKRVSGLTLIEKNGVLILKI